MNPTEIAASIVNAAIENDILVTKGVADVASDRDEDLESVNKFNADQIVNLYTAVYSAITSPSD